MNLWEQVIHILYLVQKYLKWNIKIYHIECKIILLSTKISQIRYQNILYRLQKYILEKVPKYIRLYNKIF